MKRFLVVVSVAVLMVLLAAIIGWTLFGARVLNGGSKTAIQRIHASLQVGDTKEDVLAVFDREKTERMSLKTNMFRQTWVIGMPLEFGASDFALYVQFDDKGSITSICTRTSDGIHTAPKNGPLDKGRLNKTRLR